jgi:hypothetical protein
VPLQRISTSLEGFGPSDEFPPRSRVPSPPASLRLARGLPRPAAPRQLLDRGIKCPDASRAPGSKANLGHANLLTRPGNRIPALFEQPATMQPSLVLCGCCAGWLVSLRGTALPTHILLPRHTPRKGTTAPSKGVRSSIQHSSRMTP